MVVLALPLLLLVVVAVALFARHAARPERAQFLLRAGFGLLALVTGVFLLFLVGETLDDPGGVAAIGLIAVWLLPLLGLVWLARWRPDLAVPALAGLTGLLLAVAAWASADAGSWRSFEDDRGPIRTIATFVLVASVGVLGLRRTRTAGVLLLVLGLGPQLIAGTSQLARGSLTAVSSPAVIAGLLYLAATLVERRGGRTEPVGYGPPGGFDGAAGQRHHVGGR
jgi:hypothetical protein